MRALGVAAVLGVCLAVSGQGCMRKVEGLWVERLANGQQRLWFAKRGFSVVTPSSWRPVPPTPPMRATIRRTTEEGFTITCTFHVFTDPQYRGKSPDELLDRFFGPESLMHSLEVDQEISDVHLVGTERVSVAGHPANQILYTAVGSVKGVRAPIKMSVLVVPYKSVIFTSSCGCLVEDFPSLEAEFESIQRSLRRANER